MPAQAQAWESLGTPRLAALLLAVGEQHLSVATAQERPLGYVAS